MEDNLEYANGLLTEIRENTSNLKILNDEAQAAMFEIKNRYSNHYM